VAGCGGSVARREGEEGSVKAPSPGVYVNAGCRGDRQKRDREAEREIPVSPSSSNALTCRA
jgi:hypothetical protein